MYPTLESRGDILKMLDEMTGARKQILEVCGRLSPAQLNDPVYLGTWSILKNLTHLAWAEAYMLAWIKKRPDVLPQTEWPAESPPDLAAVTKAFDEAHAASIAFLKSNPESVLTEPAKYGRQALPQTVGGIFFHLIEHEIHHRAFITHKLMKVQGK